MTPQLACLSRTCISCRHASRLPPPAPRSQHLTRCPVSPQILLDALVALAPFALYSRLGIFIVPLCGILTIFYRGFLVLSKSFLDPFGNEDSLSENFSIHCLVCETNAGSIRWRDGIERLPFADGRSGTANGNVAK